MSLLASNPARLSKTVAGLFPAGAVAAELCGPGDPELLLPAEAKYLGRAVVTRAQEFAAGRLCARRALAELGILDFALEVAGDRQPLWPESVVGSITHTAGFAAAVVAERRCAAALGLDSETIGDVKPEIWPSICVPSELIWVGSLPPAGQAEAVALIFSAKEAFYKCQYPLAGERLGFHDVAVEVPGWGPTSGIVSIESTSIDSTRSLALFQHTAMPVQGQFLFHQQFVTVGFGFLSKPCRPERF